MSQLERLLPFGLEGWPAFSAFTPVRYSAYPAVNLYETGEAYVLTAELPGLAP